MTQEKKEAYQDYKVMLMRVFATYGEGDISQDTIQLCVGIGNLCLDILEQLDVLQDLIIQQQRRD